MALFCNNSLISPFPSSAIRHAWPFKHQFSCLPIFSFKRSISIELSQTQKKPQFPKCSAEQLNNNANSPTIIFIKGLAKSTLEGRLKVVFSQFGDVSRVKIIIDKKNKQSLGFAYIWFPDNESAQSAIQEMNGKFLDGRFIQVRIAKPGSCKPNVKSAPYKF